MKRRKVIWSPRALNELDELDAYLMEEWGEITADVVLEKIEQNLSVASKWPYVFPKHPRFNQRYFIINGRTRVYYRFNRTKLEVIALYSTRRDDKLYR